MFVESQGNAATTGFPSLAGIPCNPQTPKLKYATWQVLHAPDAPWRDSSRVADMGGSSAASTAALTMEEIGSSGRIYFITFPKPWTCGKSVDLKSTSTVAESLTKTWRAQDVQCGKTFYFESVLLILESPSYCHPGEISAGSFFFFSKIFLKFRRGRFRPLFWTELQPEELLCNSATESHKNCHHTLIRIFQRSQNCPSVKHHDTLINKLPSGLLYSGLHSSSKTEGLWNTEPVMECTLLYRAFSHHPTTAIPRRVNATFDPVWLQLNQHINIFQFHLAAAPLETFLLWFLIKTDLYWSTACTGKKWHLIGLIHNQRASAWLKLDMFNTVLDFDAFMLRFH